MLRTYAVEVTELVALNPPLRSCLVPPLLTHRCAPLMPAKALTGSDVHREACDTKIWTLAAAHKKRPCRNALSGVGVTKDRRLGGSVG
jgi:hypothetical protein